MPSKLGDYWEGFEEPIQRGEGSRHAEKRREGFPLYPLYPQWPQAGSDGVRERESAHQGITNPAVADAVRSTVGRMRDKVQNLNLVFDEIIKHIRHGTEIGKHAMEQKNALNVDFNALLQLIEGQGVATGLTEQEFRPEECSTLPDHRVPQKAPEVIQAEMQRSKLLQLKKAGLLQEEERRELAGLANWAHS
jgi:hypothetical protein